MNHPFQELMRNMHPIFTMEISNVTACNNWVKANIKFNSFKDIVILFTTWYLGHTDWSTFETDQFTMQKCHLIQNVVKFQWSIFVFLNRGFHIFVLTNFPLSLFNTLSCPSIPYYCHINFQRFPHFSIMIPIFHRESLGV